MTSKIDPAFRERYRRAKQTPRSALRLMHKAKHAKDAATRQRRAGLLLEVADLGGDWDAAAAAAGLARESLRKWMFTYTGSTVWPPSEAQTEKLTHIAGKYI